MLLYHDWIIFVEITVNHIDHDNTFNIATKDKVTRNIYRICIKRFYRLSMRLLFNSSRNNFIEHDANNIFLHMNIWKFFYENECCAKEFLNKFSLFEDRYS